MLVKLTINEKTQKKEMSAGMGWKGVPESIANAKAMTTGDGLLVVDIDTKDISELDKEFIDALPRVPTVDTARGYHYYFNVDDDSKYKTITDVYPHVDLRCIGGLIFTDYWGGDDRIKYERKVEHNYDMPKDLEEYLLRSTKLAVKIKPTLPSSNTISDDKLSLEEITECISFIDPSCDYDTWIRVGMGLKNWDETLGFHVWDEWSAKSDKYNSGSMQYKWESFKDSGITEGSIIMYAKDNGYILPDRHDGFDAIDDIIPQETKFYLHNSDYYVHSDRLYSKLTQSAFKTHFRKSGIKIKKGDAIEDHIEIIHGVNHYVDFFEPSSVFLDESVNELVSIVNPTEKWNDIEEFDEEIVKEYSEQIMCGVEVDLVNLVVGAMRYSESKMNKLLLVGESNKGKTELMKLMKFVEMNAGEFKGVLKGIKWSQEQSDQLKQCGLLLADDIYFDIPIQLKNISDTATFNIMNRGSVVHPCKFMVMTTTHDSVVGSIGDELQNRIMCMRIEGGITFNDSKLVKKDKRKYQRVTQNYIKGLILSALKDPIGEEEFYALQVKYTTKGSNERDEILDSVYKYVTKAIKNDIKLEFNGRYEIIDIGGLFYVEKRMNIKKLVKETLVEHFDGMEADLNKELNLMLQKVISNERIRHNGVLYYEILPEVQEKTELYKKF